jgi:hypothetical protein
MYMTLSKHNLKNWGINSFREVSDVQQNYILYLMTSARS